MTREKFVLNWSKRRKQGPFKYVMKLSIFVLLIVLVVVMLAFTYSGIDIFNYIWINLYQVVMGTVFLYTTGLLISVAVWRECERKYMVITEEMFFEEA